MLVFCVTLLTVGNVLPVGSSSPPWTGRLKVGDRVFEDDAGEPVLPLCAHFAEAFSAWVRRPAAVEEQLRTIKAADYDCIRFWDNLGEYSDAWRGKEISPFAWTNADGVRIRPTAEYYDKLERFLQRVDQIGLRVHHSRGDLGRGRPAIPLEHVVQHSTRVGAIYDKIGWHVLAMYEANNEDFQNGNFGPSGLLRIVEPLKMRHAIVASSCPKTCSEQPADVLAYSQNFSVRYYHGQRHGDAVDRLARKFATGYQSPEGAPYLGWDGEPIGPNVNAGPGVTVNSTEDVEELVLLHAMTFVGGRSASTYMSQYGVFWNGPIHQQPGFVATPRIRAALRQFAPDIMRWRLYHGGRREAAFRSPNGYMGDAGVTHGPARMDQAVSHDRRRVVALMYGGRPPKRFRNDLGCRSTVTAVHADNGEQLRAIEFELERGEIKQLEYRIGRLLLGRCNN
ncbi:MAG TPA: hypothetical protein VEK56_18040 [Vicinamibacterales bacterium]|nr:hypothetical protein [Vicinamibacterales bacterium]